jgi:hypothetical protein
MVQPPAEARWMVCETISLFFTFLKARMKSLQKLGNLQERRRDIE